VRHLFANDHDAHSRGIPLELLRFADVLRDLKEVRGELRVHVDPVVDFGAGHNECVARRHRRDRKERDGTVVLPDETAGQLAVDDATENGGHGSPSAECSYGVVLAPSTAATVKAR
jgi:hypothetical protein